MAGRANLPRRLLLLLTARTYRAPAFVEAAERLGIEVIKAISMHRHLAEYWNYPLGLQYDDPAGSVQAIVKFAAQTPLGAIIAVDDSGSLIAAEASQALGLAHNSPDSALAARDKHVMRGLLNRAGVPSPRFKLSRCSDLDDAKCTVEEREEYEPHLLLGNPVYAGVDYAEIVARAESEVDVILWDGGNNDFPFIRPDLHIVMVDPLRAGHETTHHPGEAVLRMADIILVSKVNSASDADIRLVIDNSRQINPTATIVRGASPVLLDDPEAVRGKRVLVVEDGPTVTHGGMSYGAGYVAATLAQAAEIIDPRPYARGEIRDVYANYPHIGAVLPAVGYHPSQLQALLETINATDADVVVTATPCDIGALIDIDKPVIRARYEFAEAGEPGLASLVEDFLKINKL